MKKILSLLIGIAFSIVIINAQPPYKFSYKATITRTNGTIVASKTIALRITILPEGKVETLTPKTNEFGQIDIVIGGGISDLSSIIWSTGEHFLRVEVDVKGGDAYQLLSETQLLSAPYALYAGGVDYNNLLNKPSTVAGYGITDAATLDGVQTITNKTLIASVINSPTGIVKADVELSNVDNTSDLSKPISTATQTALDLKENILTFNAPLNRASNTIFLPAATSSNDGYLSISDKTKLDGLQNSDGSETLVTAGTNVTVTGTGTSTNPYIVNAEGGSNSNPTLLQVLVNGNDAGANRIVNLANPVNSQDAATKAYVDLLEQRILELEEILASSDIIPLTDIDGNLYKTVKIGTQIWMAENLKVTQYSDGTPITYVPDNSAWGNLDNTVAGNYLISDAYCWYDNDALTNKNTYGALYNWNTVNSGILCPTGWHVPTADEWITLTKYVGGDIAFLGTNIAGGILKETGTAHWVAPNTGATNERDFTALPGGNRSPSGTFNHIGNYGHFWSATPVYNQQIFSFNVSYDNSSFVEFSYNGNRNSGFSVRCLKD